jgi:hypothetical protein
MKKLFVGIVFVFITMACHTGNLIPPDPNSLTLNRIKFSDADAMVKDFKKNPSNYDMQNVANVYYDKAYFHNMANLVDNKIYDGIRIYFARDQNGQNTIVIVSTKDGGASTKPGKRIHNDFFQPLLTYSDGPEQRGIPGKIKDNGTLMYNTNSPCTGVVCDDDNPHYVSCGDAYVMINVSGSDPITSRGEWFDARLIGKLDSVLQSNPKLDGIRIYYCKRDSSPIVHHGFVFSLTEPIANGQHKDNLECIILGQKKDKHKVDEWDNGEECPESCEGAFWPYP